MPKSSLTKRLRFHAQFRIVQRELPFIRPKEVRKAINNGTAIYTKTNSGRIIARYQKEGFLLKIIMNKGMNCIISAMPIKSSP